MTTVLRWREVAPVRWRWIGPFEQQALLPGPHIGGVAAIIGPPGSSAPGGGPVPEGVLTEALGDLRYALATDVFTVEQVNFRTKVALVLAYFPTDRPERRLAAALTAAWSRDTLAERLSVLLEWAAGEAASLPPGDPGTSTDPADNLAMLATMANILKPGLPREEAAKYPDVISLG